MSWAKAINRIEITIVDYLVVTKNSIYYSLKKEYMPLGAVLNIYLCQFNRIGCH